MEILIFITLAITILGYFYPRYLQSKWLQWMPLLVLMFLIIDWVIEGYRWQLLPIYLLTIILLIFARFGQRKLVESESFGYRMIRYFVGSLGILFLTLATILLAFYQIEAVILPPKAISLELNEVNKTCEKQNVAQFIDTNSSNPISVSLTVIAEGTQYLQTPRDLAFNPQVEGELWVVNGGDSSVAIIHNTLSSNRTIEYRKDGLAKHFMHRPSAIAFGGRDTTIGKPGTFATVQESTNDGYLDVSARNFMGPTLFSSDLNVFAKPQLFDQQSSHLDMLHESPLGMGIAWEKENVYWVFGGAYQDIVRYDFRIDHGVGNSDHSDGVIHHYVSGQVKRYPKVPSHMAFEPNSKMLFIADTGHQRIVELDTTSGRLGKAHVGVGTEAGVEDFYVEKANLIEFVPPNNGLIRPSGLTIHREQVWVSDNATGLISIYNLQGNLVNQLDTGLVAGALMGITFGSDNKLYLVDALGDRVLRIDCL